MKDRTRFPFVFWVANGIEILERFAYYGIYMGFGIYLQQLGYSKGDLGIIQSIFLALSYIIPLFSGTFADKYGFKKVLIISRKFFLANSELTLITLDFPPAPISLNPMVFVFVFLLIALFAILSSSFSF